MRDPQRIDRVLDKIRSYWLAHPDLRLCQIIATIIATNGYKHEDIFYVEDEEFEKAIDGILKSRG